MCCNILLLFFVWSRQIVKSKQFKRLVKQIKACPFFAKRVDEALLPFFPVNITITIIIIVISFALLKSLVRLIITTIITIITTTITIITKTTFALLNPL